MKKTLLTVAVAAVVAMGAVSLRAQQNSAMSQAGSSSGSLELSAEQQKKYDEIRAESRKKIEAVYKEMRVYQDKIEAIQAEEKAEFEKILNSDQKQIYDAMEAERQAIIEARKARMEEMRKARMNTAKSQQ